VSAADEKLAWIALARALLSAAWWKTAVLAAGSAHALFECDDAKLRELELTAEGIRALRAQASWDARERERARCTHLGIEIAEFTGDAYPALLREIADPPPLLYFRGAPPAAADPAVAIVGSRRATRYGRRTAERIASELAAGPVLDRSALAIDGSDLIEELGLEPGPEIGRILAALFERIVEEPQLNDRAHLLLMARDLMLGADPRQ